MSRRLPLPFGKFRMGCGIRHVGDLPGGETDIRMQVQRDIQENTGMFSVMCGGEACIETGKRVSGRYAGCSFLISLMKNTEFLAEKPCDFAYWCR